MAARIMQVLYSMSLERAMSDATRLAKADNQQCMQGPGPGATGRLASQDAQYLSGGSD